MKTLLKVSTGARRQWGLLSLLAFVVALFVLAPISGIAALAVGMAPLGGALVDSQLFMSDAQALAASGASTNIIDTASVPQNFVAGTFTAERRLGTGEPLALVINILAIDASSADETYAAQLQSDDNSGFGSPASVGDSIPISRSLPVGTRLYRAIPPGALTERFLRMNYTLGGTTPAITVDAYITPMNMLQNEAVYPKNFLVSV